MSATWEFEQLLGEWFFEREILGKGRMNGVATITWVEGKRALYCESGELVLENGQRLHTRQRYFYDPIERGFEVRFCDTDKLFHQLIFEPTREGEWSALANHNCAADRYDSEYLFRPDETLKIRHKVIGPHKNYDIRTIYRKRAIA